MLRFFKSKFFIIFLILVVVVSCMGIYSELTEGKASPLQDGVNIVLSPIRSFFTMAANKYEDIVGYITEYDDLKAENEELKSLLANKESEIRKSEQILEENKRLRQLLDMRERNTSYDIESAEIIAVESGSWGATYTLDRGSDAGVSEGDCVITGEGVAGFITTVGTTWSEMETVLSTETKAGAIVSRTRDTGVAEGTIDLMHEGVFKISYLPKDNEVRIGDTVETSGLGGIYPKGLALGTVVSVGIEAHGISSYAVVEPAADLNELSLVFIIRDFESNE